jgi:CBS domain-containing protein
MITVKEIMTSKPYVLKAEDTLQDACRLMNEKGIRHVPIVDKDDYLLGLITHRDVLAASDTLLEQGNEEGGNQSSRVLGDLMVRDVESTHPNSALRRTALRLQSLKVGCMPVLDEGKLVGIITDTDFVGVAINLLEQLEMQDQLVMEEF